MTRIPFVSLAVLSAISLGLAACSTSTPYAAAADSQSGYGFSEQRIEDNRFRITFRGNSLTDRETVENYLLYRSAEVTLENGYDYFLVVEDETEKSTTYTGSRDPWGYYGLGRPFPYYGRGYRWGPFDDDISIRERNRYSAMAYILMGKGPKPADQPTAYDARQVVTNLRPVVIMPEVQ
ncbi:CC0125/CC1285 family lipoprotein [Parvularcula sp. LCG005]|uniref:CC0125/CC1285 family lipoprotein n=1 Tax=Parvularcula sp. LCG005 TaxID=3078805 RepID=UPI0029434AC6|nr:hypothetical protein [Parvularcula sp. LCG005]WOI53297.1 hypothetical protein RUI03_14215 [Parvularcula sp. LCG005]